MRYVKNSTLWYESHNETSNYDMHDYRSKLYKGKWVNHWLTDVMCKALYEHKEPEEVMWKLCEEKTEHMPKALFKFFPFNQNSIKCIEDNRVYLNSPENFNDPYDCYIAISEEKFIKYHLLEKIQKLSLIERGVISREEYNKILASTCQEKNSNWRKDTLNMFSSVMNRICLQHQDENEIGKILQGARLLYKDKTHVLRKERFRIASFSKMSEAELLGCMEMWGHYANNHSGFCVEYDTEDSISDERWNSIVKGGLLPCFYSATQRSIPSYTFYKYASDKEMTDNQIKQFNKAIIATMLTKSSSWSYEKEWRLVLSKKISDLYDGLVPFYRIKNIYLGCKMSLLDRRYMYQFCKRKNIQVYDMKLKNDFYELDMSPVNIDDKMQAEDFLSTQRLKRQGIDIFKFK